MPLTIIVETHLLKTIYVVDSYSLDFQLFLKFGDKKWKK